MVAVAIVSFAISKSEPIGEMGLSDVSSDVHTLSSLSLIPLTAVLISFIHQLFECVLREFPRWVVANDNLHHYQHIQGSGGQKRA